MTIFLSITIFGSSIFLDASIALSRRFATRDRDDDRGSTDVAAVRSEYPSGSVLMSRGAFKVDHLVDDLISCLNLIVKCINFFGKTVKIFFQGIVFVLAEQTIG